MRWRKIAALPRKKEDGKTCSKFFSGISTFKKN